MSGTQIHSGLYDGPVAREIDEAWAMWFKCCKIYSAACRLSLNNQRTLDHMFAQVERYWAKYNSLIQKHLRQ
jgi:hypothetical protein